VFNQFHCYGTKNLFNFKNHENPFTVTISKRFYPEPAKRFYAETIVSPVEDHFEINLDKRKLKTPQQKVFQVKNEALANMIASEWAAQRKHVGLSSMHLTGLANTTQDNPLHKSKLNLVNGILNVLEEDTILYYSVGDRKLVKLQVEKWKPIMDWFDKEFRVNVPIILNAILPPEISEDLKLTLRSYLMSLSYESVQGLAYGITAIRSVILTIAAAKGRLTAEEAVHISRLETSYQVDHWGNVEWFHDVELYDSIARLSAAVLFYQCHGNIFVTNSKVRKQKQKI